MKWLCPFAILRLNEKGVGLSKKECAAGDAFGSMMLALGLAWLIFTPPISLRTTEPFILNNYVNSGSF